LHLSMQPLRIQSATEQVAEYLRREILKGTWVGTMPGENHLLSQLNVGGNTIKLALVQLEKEGLLIGQGPGRRRLISMQEQAPPSTLRVAILNFDSLSKFERYQIEMTHLLSEAGHYPFLTGKTLMELKMDVKRVARMVKRTDADAWVTCAASRGVHEWFVEQKIPVFAQFGGQNGIPIAGIALDRDLSGLRSVVTRLIDLGHRRIVSLLHRGYRSGVVGSGNRMFLDEMKAHGIATGPFNIPQWEDGVIDFRKCLESLFEHTPPTALLIGEAPYLFAAVQFCAERGLRIPQDISLFCWDYSQCFSVSNPSIAHMNWDYQPIARRTVRWVNNVAHGKDDRRQSNIKVEFLEGGTVGPAPSVK
ncbi:MAG: substrate-binding domain-containing protein, partial [Akkermansiaceae bacterium]